MGEVVAAVEDEVLGVVLATVSSVFCVSEIVLFCRSVLVLLVLSVAATELLELVVSVLLGVEEVDELVLELGGVEVRSAYVPLVPWAVLEEPVGLVDAVVSVELLAVAEDGGVELAVRSDELVWPLVAG